MKQTIKLFALITSLTILAGCNNQQMVPTNPTNDGSNDQSGITNLGTGMEALKVSSGYTLDEIAKHNIKSNCWTTINGNVYDITSAFGKHKGGDKALIGLCGIDGTTKFEEQHGDNANARGRLATLKIGKLK